MAETDTSSYPKGAMPVSMLDIAGKIGGLQQQKLGIDQAKLDQANQALGYMVRAMGSLGPNAKKEDYAKAAQNAVDQGLVPQQQENIFLQHLQAAPDSPSFYKQFMTSAMEGQKQIEMHTGINSEKNDNATNYQGKTDVLTGGFKPATQMPVQIPPGTPNYDENNQQVLTPPAGPAGVVPVPRPRPGLAGLTTGPTGPTVETTGGPGSPPATFAQRTDAAFPKPLKAGPSPMFAASQAMLAKDRETATAKATALKPLEEAHDLAKLVSTGAGTETLNKARAYLTNAGLMDANEKNPTVIYQMLNKNLAGFVDKNGTRSDADLAVKESSNANAKTQVQPALLHMIQKIIGREKIEIARPGAFDGSDVGKYSEHSSKFPTSQDERAYTIDKMKPEDAKQLYIEMKNKALNGKGAEQAEGIKFLKSLSIAKKQGLINGIN